VETFDPVENIYIEAYNVNEIDPPMLSAQCGSTVKVFIVFIF
jgi:hypothetical protein